MSRSAVLAVALLLLASCTREVGLVKGRQPVIAGTLAGGPWLIEDVNGGGVIDSARLDLTFGGDGAAGSGRVAGHSGCNRFTGAWVQTGAVLKLGPITRTEMTCRLPALMTLEAKVLAAIDATVTVRFDTTGAAFLETADGRVLKLRREAP